LTERISVVGGGATGLGISHALDPNVYLLSGGEELALVDAGAGLGEDRILDNVRSLGYEPERIKHIFLTHAHADHAGGAASLAERLRAQVYLSELEREALENADEEALSPGGMVITPRTIGCVPAGSTWPCRETRSCGVGIWSWS
jgi:hydroxyacylglutathione hydrolase